MPDDPLRIELTFPASPATPGFEYMQIAEDGAVVKKAGVSESMLTFEGKAIIFDSQEEAINYLK